MILFPDINPVALTIPQLKVVNTYFGPIDIHWYGLAYMAAFLVGLWYFKRLCAKHPAPNLAPKMADDLLFWLFLGVMLGGRLGYVLFYNLPYYLQNPAHIFYVWEGGMAFHGGFLGVLLASFGFAWRHNINWLDITDRLAPTVCFGLFFGRLANFINAELYGHQTNLPWGVVFPNSGGVPRHPSQLYEAALEGLLIFIILNFIMRRGFKRGQLSAAFLFLYGLFRSGVEFVRQPDPFPHLSGGMFEWLTMGQMLSLPMMVLGAILFFKFKRK